MKVLIAGGAGLLGNRLSEYLTKGGYSVVHLSRNPQPDSKYPTFHWDVEKKIIDTSAFNDVDFVINLAGEGIANKKWTKAQKEKIISSRVESNQLLKATFIENNFLPKKYISAAAIGYYGNSDTIEFDEDSKPVSSGFLPECCQIWENAIQDMQSIGIPTAWIRIGIVLSTQGGALQKMLQTAKLGLNTYFGNGKQTSSWIHIDDLCKIFLHLLENEKAVGVYNGCSPAPVSNYQMSKVIAKEISPISFVLPLPAFLIKIIFGEMSALLLDSTKVFPKKLISESFIFEYTALEKAIRDLWKRKI